MVILHHLLPQVTSYSTSFSVWTALSSVFNVRSKARILQVKNKLINCKKDNKSVDAYLIEITRLAEEAREASVPIDDDELTLMP